MYLCCLRDKDGERRALMNIEDELRENFLPLVIMNDASKDELNLLLKKYSHQMLLDTRLLDVDDIGVLEEILDNPHYASSIQMAYPIEHLLDDLTKMKRANYAKIAGNNLNTFFFKWALTNIQNLPKTLIFDFEYIDKSSMATLSFEKEFIDLLDALGKADSQVFILSGSVPYPIPAKMIETYVQDRYEITFFHNVIDQLEDSSHVHYGDYATIHPLTLPPPKPNSMPIPVVQVKYSTVDKFKFFRNGRRMGDYKFYEVCSDVVESIPNFDSNYSWGDEQIYNCHLAQANKGNPSVWASIGINHHVTLSLKE